MDHGKDRISCNDFVMNQYGQTGLVVSMTKVNGRMLVLVEYESGISYWDMIDRVTKISARKHLGHTVRRILHTSIRRLTRGSILIATTASIVGWLALPNPNLLFKWLPLLATQIERGLLGPFLFINYDFSTKRNIKYPLSICCTTACELLHSRSPPLAL